MTQRFAGFRLVFAVVALALWAGDAANAQVERTPTAENVVRNVKRNSIAAPKVAPRQASEAPEACPWPVGKEYPPCPLTPPPKNLTADSDGASEQSRNSHVSTYTIGATDAGWYRRLTFGCFPDNTNYLVGNYDRYRNYFVFNVEDFDRCNDVIWARLILWNPYPVNFQSTYRVTSVDPAVALCSLTFDQLGTGTSYGQVANIGTQEYVYIPLNTQAIVDIKNSGMFYVSGQLLDKHDPSTLFGSTSLAGSYLQIKFQQNHCCGVADSACCGGEKPIQNNPCCNNGLPLSNKCCLHGAVVTNPCCDGGVPWLSGNCCDGSGNIIAKKPCCDLTATPPVPIITNPGCCDVTGASLDSPCCTATTPPEPLENNCCLGTGAPKPNDLSNPCCNVGEVVDSGCCNFQGVPSNFDEAIIKVDMKPNHFAYHRDSTPKFYKLPPKGNGGGYPDDFTISDTFGCSCTAIVDICGYGAVHKEKGCPPSDLEAAALSCGGGEPSECVVAGHECISTLVEGQKICCKVD